MDLEDRLAALEKRIGLPNDENDLTPIQVINKVESELQSNNLNYKTLQDHAEVIDMIKNNDISLATKKQALVRLEVINSDLKALNIEDLEENLETLKNLEPVIDKSKETFNNLLQHEKEENENKEVKKLVDENLGDGSDTHQLALGVEGKYKFSKFF